jgi:hypothetical protein
MAFLTPVRLKIDHFGQNLSKMNESKKKKGIEDLLSISDRIMAKTYRAKNQGQ